MGAMLVEGNKEGKLIFNESVGAILFKGWKLQILGEPLTTILVKGEKELVWSKVYKSPISNFLFYLLSNTVLSLTKFYSL